MSLPDVLKVKALPTIQNMRIRSFVLEPQTMTQSVAVFQLPKEGILSSGSILTFKILATGPNANEAFLPLRTGCRGAIDRAELRIGDQLVASSTDFGHISTLRRLCHTTAEERAQVDMLKTGCVGDRYAEIDQGKAGYRDLTYAANTAGAD